MCVVRQAGFAMTRCAAGLDSCSAYSGIGGTGGATAEDIA